MSDFNQRARAFMASHYMTPKERDRHKLKLIIARQFGRARSTRHEIK